MNVEKINVAKQKNSKKYCHKGIGSNLQKQYWYRQYFMPKYCYRYWRQFSQVC